MDTMKENIFDVLIYLFENYLEDEIDLMPDSEGIKAELRLAGFKNNEINRAFDWLESLAEQSNIQPSISATFRIFSEPEKQKLDIECRNFLLFLERSGILTTTTREIVIDRAMAIENNRLTLEELKWAVLMVLLNQSDDDIAFSRMEDIIYDLVPTLFH